MRRYAIIKLQKEGYHKYPNAPQAVEFLKNVHRHIFYITVKIEQSHANRDIEYIQFKHWLEDNIKFDRLYESFSCEILAEDILDLVLSKFNYDDERNVIVKVMEDNENGAEVEYIVN